MYEETFNEVLLYEKSDVKNENVHYRFTNSLTNILNRHRSVVELVAHGVMEYKENISENRTSAIEEEKIQYFLDRFYISRIGIRFLINQHSKNFVVAGPNMSTKKPLVVIQVGLWTVHSGPQHPCSWLILQYF